MLNQALHQLLQREYGVSGRLTRLPGENLNYRVDRDDHVDRVDRGPGGIGAEDGTYVLKICAATDQAGVPGLEEEAIRSLAAAEPGLGLPLTLATTSGALQCQVDLEDVQGRARLLRFVEGTSWARSAAPSTQRLRALGSLAATTARALADVQHPAAERTHRWDLAAAGAHRSAIPLIEGDARQVLAERAFFLHSACAAPRLQQLPRGLIHGDLNGENILVDGDRITGLLDFGDCLVNPLVCELAIAMAYALMDAEDPWSRGGEIVIGYQQRRALSAAELEVLYPLVCGRLAVSVTIAAQRRRIDPERSSWFSCEESAWQLLETLLATDPLTAADLWGGACRRRETGCQEQAGEETIPFGDRVGEHKTALTQRQQHFADNLSLSYQEPVSLSRGRGAILFDHRERPLLDLYNNVCHVGHCHPRVVAAGQRQMARLNTNSRYLHDLMNEYAARLCATLPAPLDTCYLVNSGSEANDLALRMVRAHTGRRDVLVVEGAYHGHTTATVALSPYKLGRNADSPPWVHPLPLADGFRGRLRGQDKETGAAYAALALQVMETMPRPPAAFFCESLLSCSGQVIPPEDYLRLVCEQVRAAGGLCVLDEVQTGFGRTGETFWAFEAQGAIPDLVVLGKPMGNGHPLAAVITRRDIAESFARETGEFFSTYGANPVSCAIGLAVLDVLEQEQLQAHAAALGIHLLQSLRAVADRHPSVGEVRGRGLFLGIELVADPHTLEPGPAQAFELVNRLRRCGILTGVDGPDRNVIKIKPPLVLSQDDAEMFVRQLDRSLRELGPDFRAGRMKGAAIRDLD